jgi:hypothetical protein
MPLRRTPLAHEPEATLAQAFTSATRSSAAMGHGAAK